MAAQRAFAYAQTPAPLILDPDVSALERRLYDFLDLKAGTRGYWDDSLVQIARALGASRRHLGPALRRLEERGLIARESLGHWRTRFVVVERVRGAQLPLDEHPPEVRGGEPNGRRGVSPTGAGGEPNGLTPPGLHLYPIKDPNTQKKITHARGRVQQVAGEAYNRVMRREWPPAGGGGEEVAS